MPVSCQTTPPSTINTAQQSFTFFRNHRNNEPITKHLALVALVAPDACTWSTGIRDRFCIFMQFERALVFSKKALTFSKKSTPFSEKSPPFTPTPPLRAKTAYLCMLVHKYAFPSCTMMGHQVQVVQQFFDFRFRFSPLLPPRLFTNFNHQLHPQHLISPPQEVGGSTTKAGYFDDYSNSISMSNMLRITLDNMASKCSFLT